MFERLKAGSVHEVFPVKWCEGDDGDVLMRRAGEWVADPPEELVAGELYIVAGDVSSPSGFTCENERGRFFFGKLEVVDEGAVVDPTDAFAADEWADELAEEWVCVARLFIRVAIFSKMGCT